MYMPNIDFTNPDVRQWLNLILIFLVCVLLYIAYKLTRYIDTKKQQIMRSNLGSQKQARS